MNYSDVDPSKVYKGSVLRKTKKQVVYFKHGVLNDIDSIVSIDNLKYWREHQDKLHSIESNYFFLHYWSPAQEHDIYIKHIEDKNGPRNLLMQLSL